jgi:ribosomal protein S18 acetylase RimI-like enzyme
VRHDEPVDQNLEETRRVVEARGPAALVIDDLRIEDLSEIAWSGTPAHLRSVAGYLAEVDQNRIEYLAVRSVDGTPVAKGAVNYAEARGVGVLMQMATHPELQGLGLGTTLIRAGEQRIGRRGLMIARIGVEDDNPRARALYERLGYIPIERRAVSWEAERPDGSLFLYETVITEMDKDLG